MRSILSSVFSRNNSEISEMRQFGYKTKLRNQGFKIGHSDLPGRSDRTPNSELLFQNRGFTLIEIIIVIVILSIISAISIKFVVDSLRIYTMTVNQKTLFDEGKLALERMCRDIRDARSISRPLAGSSSNWMRLIRTTATFGDVAGETIDYELTGTNLEKDKATPNVTVTLASNVSSFTVTRSANDEMTLELTLSLGTGENVTLRTRVYPKNLADSTIYRYYFLNWKEELSS